MSTLLTLLAVWAVITVLGHGSWVFVRQIVQRLGDRGERSRPGQLERTQASAASKDSRPSAQDDLPPFARMLDALTATGQLPVADAERLKNSARTIARQQASPSSSAAAPADAPPRQDPVENLTPPAPATPPPDQLAAPTSVETEASSGPATASVIGGRAATATPATPVQTPPAAPPEPRRPLSEAVSAFLARNQIRWGELVAGILIVVSSVGLVVSLWSTLTTAHRVVPSLIFISADAAIFAAGLYTMRRWRLRHTSRAVLIIATLLVPLCVLAGLAAAGTDMTTASLTDPVTWAAMLAGSLGVGWLLWQSSIVLVGRGQAAALAASVAVPSLCLPMLPAAGRVLSSTPWGSMSGWFVILPSLAVAAAFSWPRRTRVRRPVLDTDLERSPGDTTERFEKPSTRRVMKNRHLALAIGTASLVALFAYAAFLLPGPEPKQTWIQIALASIPAWVAIAACSRIDAIGLAAQVQHGRLHLSRLNKFIPVSRAALASPPELEGKPELADKRELAGDDGAGPPEQTRWQTTAMVVASTVAILAGGIVLGILPASVERPSWVWAHGGIAALSVVLVAMVSRRFADAIWGLVPVGVACCLTSSSWLAAPGFAAPAWAALSPHQLVLGGAPMIAGLGWAIAVGLLAWALGGRPAGRRAAKIAVGFGAYSVAVAVALSVAPTGWRGGWPMSAVLFVLTCGIAGSLAAARYRARLGYLLIATVAAWHWTWLPLIAWDSETGHPDFLTSAAPVWMVLVAGTLLVVGTAIRMTHRASPGPSRDTVITLARERWNRWAYGLAAAGGLAQWALMFLSPAPSPPGPHWLAAASLWSAVTLIMGTTAGVAGQRDWLRGAIAISLSVPLALATSVHGVDSWNVSGWLQPFPAWQLIACLTATAVAWRLARELVAKSAQLSPLQSRRWDLSQQLWKSAADMPDGWMAWGSVVLIGWIALQYVGSILLAPTSPAWPAGIETNITTPPTMHWAGWAILLLTGFVAVAWRQRETIPQTARLLAAWSLAASTLAAAQFAMIASDTAVGRLVGLVMTAVTLLATTALIDRLPGRAFGRLQNHAWLKRTLDGFDHRIRVIETAIAVWIGLGSASLLIGHWATPIFANDTLPDVTSTAVVAAWWLAAAGVLLPAGRQSTTRLVISALLVPAALVVLAPLTGERSTAVWIQWSVWGSVAWIIAAAYGVGVQTRRQPVAACSWGYVAGVGLLSGLLGYSPLFYQTPLASTWTGTAGLLASGLAAALCVGYLLRPARWSWPVGALIITGQLAGTVVAFNGSIQQAFDVTVRWEWVAGVAWLAAAYGSAVGRVVHGTLLHTVVLAITSCGLFVLALFGFTDLTVAGSLFAFAGLIALGGGLAASGLTTQGRLSDSATRGGGLSVSDTSLIGKPWWRAGRPWWTRGPLESEVARVLLRLLGWFVLLGGLYLLVEGTLTGGRPRLQWTAGPTWLAIWCLTWRAAARWTEAKKPSRARLPLADSEASWLLLPIVWMVAAAIWNSGSLPANAAPAMADLWFRGGWIAAMAGLVATAAWLRPWGTAVWHSALLLLASASGLLAMIVAQSVGLAEDWTPVIAAALAAAAVMVVWSAGFGRLSLFLHRRGWLPQPAKDAGDPIPLGQRISRATAQVTLWLAGLDTLLVVAVSMEPDGLRQTQLSLLAPALLAWVFFQLSEQFATGQSSTGQSAVDASDELSPRYRRRCVQLALWTLGLLAVLAAPASPYPALLSTMRLLIVSVLAIAGLALGLPRLLGSYYGQRWANALRHGSHCAAVTAGISLLAMLLLEFVHRSSAEGLPELPLPMVIAVALVLAALAVLAAVLTVLTFQPEDSELAHSSNPPVETNRPAEANRPAGASRKRLSGWTDAKRKHCLVAAQVVAAAAWGHQYLCRPDMAMLGLRSAWPYLVMVIAFVSVGLQQWASRRGDRVISETMRRTALFLPMIPVVGFWLSGSWALWAEQAGWTWKYLGDVGGDGKIAPGVSYQGLLLFAACYYGMLSWMWKQQIPRIATVVLANAALWVTLTQLPGWGFLAHPQAWLIPPAVCLLAVAHWYRDQLAPPTRSAIRYGGTLVIYISSTADMLLADIGTSLAGPMVLILLALAGMLAGVALRIKPFLYLGTVFVFLGVTSMVWHAGQAIDAVWPWWVFGITMGVLLLTFLAMLERHRATFQRWAEQLARWEGG